MALEGLSEQLETMGRPVNLPEDLVIQPDRLCDLCQVYIWPEGCMGRTLLLEAGANNNLFKGLELVLDISKDPTMMATCPGLRSCVQAVETDLNLRIQIPTLPQYKLQPKH